MPKYTLPTIAKAVAAFGVTAVSTAAAFAHGVDLSVLGLGEWLSVLGAALTAGGGVFVTPNKPTDPPLSPADQVVNGIQSVIAAQSAATAEVERVKTAVTAAVGTVPAIGALVPQMVNINGLDAVTDTVKELERQWHNAGLWSRP